MEMKELVAKAEKGLIATDADGQKRDITNAVGRALRDAALEAKKNLCPKCGADLRTHRVVDPDGRVWCGHCAHILVAAKP
jgi:ribosomal protein S27AE